MTKNDQALLDGVKQMEEEAPSVGLCGFPFRILREEIAKLIEERDSLKDAARWVAVADRLPDPKTDVEVAFDDGEVWCLWQDWKNWQDMPSEDCDVNPLTYYVDHIDGPVHTVTHWRPMPKAPEGK